MKRTPTKRKRLITRSQVTVSKAGQRSGTRSQVTVSKLSRLQKRLLILALQHLKWWAHIKIVRDLLPERLPSRCWNCNCRGLWHTGCPACAALETQHRHREAVRLATRRSLIRLGQRGLLEPKETWPY